MGRPRPLCPQPAPGRRHVPLGARRPRCFTGSPGVYESHRTPAILTTPPFEPSVIVWSAFSMDVSSTTVTYDETIAWGHRSENTLTAAA
jgi:hypothetical protein